MYSIGHSFDSFFYYKYTQYFMILCIRHKYYNGMPYNRTCILTWSPQIDHLNLFIRFNLHIICTESRDFKFK